MILPAQHWGASTRRHYQVALWRFSFQSSALTSRGRWHLFLVNVEEVELKVAKGTSQSHIGSSRVEPNTDCLWIRQVIRFQNGLLIFEGQKAEQTQIFLFSSSSFFFFWARILLCCLGWSRLKLSPYLSVLSAGLTGLCHHIQQNRHFFKEDI